MEQSLQGKVCVVTGANTGIGKVTAQELARAGATVVLACRSRQKTEEAMNDIRKDIPEAKLEFLELDLASLESVRKAAAEFLASERPLHILVNNAGLAGTRGQTKDGFELTFGVNHVGPYLFTRLLLDRVVESAPARIVNVSSKSHYQTKDFDLSGVKERTKTIGGIPEYALSKLANVLFTIELDKRLQGTGVSTYALHPGVVASDVWRSVPWPVRSVIKLFMLTNEEGAQTTLHCALSDEAGKESGLYYEKSRPKKASRLARDPALPKQLWDASAEWVGIPTETEKRAISNGQHAQNQTA
ncbi:MAG: SDR family oxidoreductase [Polyangiaceae bacterium]|nr:SDR family oxidoreductase [Polyangiaceae bacterium]